jgi:putative hydrolase of the HAD superfamily
MKIKTILFDAFGTLFDTDSIHARICKRIAKDIFEKRGVRLSETSLFKSWILEWAIIARATVEKGFLSTKTVVRKSLKKSLLNKGLAPSNEELSKWVQLFIDSFTSETKLNKDARSTLQWLKSHGYTLGMVSDADQQMFNSLIDRFGIRPFFNFFMVSDEIRAWKFSTKPFDEALKKAGSKPSETLMIGNSLEEDIGVGQKSGLVTILFAEKPSLNQKIKPNWIITQISEVVKIVQQMNEDINAKGGERAR